MRLSVSFNCAIVVIAKNTLAPTNETNNPVPNVSPFKKPLMSQLKEGSRMNERESIVSTDKNTSPVHPWKSSVMRMRAIKAAPRTMVAEKTKPHGKAMKEITDEPTRPKNFTIGDKRWSGESPC